MTQINLAVINKMNKKYVILLLIVGVLSSGIRVSAQDQNSYSRFELSASTGLVMTGMPKNDASPSSLPLVYDVTGKFFTKPWLSLGLSMGNNRDVYWGDDLEIWLTPSIDFHWLRKSSFTAYSGISYTIPMNGNWKGVLSGEWYQGFEYTPIGITFGHSIFGLAELGFGPRYFPLRLGIGYRF